MLRRTAMRGSGISPSKCQPGSSGSFRIVTLAVMALCCWLSQPLLVRGQTTAWTEVVVVSTPVIDPATGTIYVVAKTVEGDNFVHRLHALDVTTGLEKFGGPVKIAATFMSAGKTYNFADKQQVNRPGLLVANANEYIPAGSNGCNNSER